MTEHYFEPEMDVVEFPDVDVITTSEPFGFDGAYLGTVTEWTDNPDTNGPGDSFLE